VSADEQRLKKLQADRNRLNTLLTQLKKQKEELARIERERAEAERLAAEKARREGKKLPDKKVIRPLVKGGFIKQKGRLQCPVSLTATTKFGQRIVSSGMRSEGVFYDTKVSVPLKSIFRGRVLFADFLKGFGLLLIVDHGDDHISLYGHNEVIYKKVGDDVDTNEVIAKTGTTGGLKSPGLYFEIRNNTTPINPATWCQ
ncbi:MAG: peptidoglycan DD-metalloendopeptidase family protein, partial [Acidiferrobacterales bacterium]|nr:peptidoglycan DD-metalloendopeptidase family protein [Acidiferrobacterales bacterium]